MKKLLSVLLIIVLVFGLVLPASATESLDSRLTRVTLSVKNTLGSIGEGFENFDGTLTENRFTPYWNLSWYNDNMDEKIYVIANEDGKIFSYSYYNDEYYDRYDYSPYFEPAFPTVTQTDAKNIALSFLDKVLDENESVILEEYDKTAKKESNYRFYGNIYVNGLKSPFDISISVNSANLKVTDYSRDELNTTIKGGYPSQIPTITQDTAKKLLSDIYELEPLYILTDDTKNARLVYLPQHNTNLVVDAFSGELVDKAGRYRPLRKATDAATEENGQADAVSGLTEAELEGIAQLEGVMTPKKLDSMLLNTKILGLNSNFELQDTRYYLNKETDEIYATVYYKADIKDFSEYGITDKTDTKNPYIYKNLKVDATSGKILSVYTYYNGIYPRTTEETEAVEIPDKILEFIKSNHPDEFSTSDLYASRAVNNGVVQDQYTYCPIPNGYFYTGNSINVTVNRYTGKLDQYSIVWDSDITYEPVGAIVPQQKALTTYADGFEYELGYTLKAEEPTSDLYPQAFEIILSYAPYFDGYITGVSATTGELVFDTRDPAQLTISYDDIDEFSQSDKIEALADYGIGFYSNSFEPNAILSQRDMLLLLISADGYKFSIDDIDEETLDRIYDIAYNLRILDKDSKNPYKTVTRAEMVRTLVSMSGYGKAAGYRDIFICGFADDNDISSEDYGFIAIGKGLGVISGDSNDSFRPNEAVTRLEAAVMLYNFMCRD